MNKNKVRELERRIDEVLYYVWDPIGVSDIPAARGEYSSYTMTILKYVLEEDLKKVANQLSKIQRDSMCMATDEVENLKIAEQLIDFKDAIEVGLK